MSSNKRAFSLIELSIVILVIGILIAGVTQGSKLIYKARISAARTFTQSSPVAGIENLILWMDASSADNVFNLSDSSYVEDGDEIKSWIDQNPQMVNKLTFSIGTTNLYPIYRDKVANGLPALEFDGADDYLTTPDEPRIAQPKNHTIFAVFSPLSGNSTNNGIGFFSKQPESGVNNFPYALGFKGTDLRPKYRTTDNSDTVIIVAGATSVVAIDSLIMYSLSYNSDQITKGAKFYMNGASIVEQDSNSSVKNSGTELVIGAADLGSPSRFCKCLVSEIIMYDRVLKVSERKSVEKYLSTKWKIDLEA